MKSLFKLIQPYTITVKSVRRSILSTTAKKTCFSYLSPNPFNNFLASRKMSQKSITSFFKTTPHKSSPVKKETPTDEQSPRSPELAASEPARNGATSPVSSDEDKKPPKRLRVDSDSQSPPPSKQSSTVGSEQKRKSKRLRIESSESESEVPSVEEKQPEIKLEKTSEHKTYASPRSKKPKVKVEKSPLVEKSVNSETPPSSKKNPIKKQQTKETDRKLASLFVKKEAKDTNNEKSSTVVEKENGEAETEEDAPKVPEELYEPGKASYHPTRDACWARGQPVPYLALARTLLAIEGTAARLRMVDTLANYLRSVITLTPDDLLPSIYMCLNQLAPAYHSLELGIAETYLMKAIGQCTGRTLAQVRAAAAREGDLGRVGEAARATQRTLSTPQPLTVRKVFAALQEIARMTGQASVNKKIAKIQSLYIACRHSEARYLIRSLEGKLRIGLAEQSVLQALAVAATRTPPTPGGGVDALDASQGIPADKFKVLVEEQALIVKTTYCECPDYGAIVSALLAHGLRALPQHCRLTPGVPLKPMLAHPTKGLGELFTRFENAEFTCEWKYDGERAQIHVPEAEGGGPDLARAAVFSRNQEDNTSKYPDVLRRLPSLLKPDVTSCVLDAEAVAYDVVNKQILPFQVLSTRKRKDAREEDIKVQVCVFVFDVLYLNGRALVREPLAARRDLLRAHFHEVDGEWQMARSRDCSTAEEVQQFLEESIQGSCEGLMVKMLHGPDARYDIARRSHNWLKLKKDYLEGVGDSIDAVVVGAYRGRGRRAGRWGGFLLACRDADSEDFQSLCKIGTGFTDDDLQTLGDALNEHIIDGPKSYYRFDPSHSPDVWFAAARVWEVRCADLSLSPAHRAAIGLVDPDKGISLRFPRFIRERPDKTAEQATSAQQVAEMYLAQDQVRNLPAKPAGIDDFY